VSTDEHQIPTNDQPETAVLADPPAEETSTGSPSQDVPEPASDEVAVGAPDDAPDDAAGDAPDDAAGDAPADDADVAADDQADDQAEDSARDAAAADEDDEDGESSAEPAETRGRTRGSGAARLEREGEIAADFLERLLDIADLDGDLDVDVEGERASVAIVDSPEGRVPRRLVGQNGEVLEALQELSRLAVQAGTGDRSRLMLDVAGHRARRREQLVVRAQEAIAQVKDSGEPLRLEAMNPFERKIVHDEVSAAGLSSSSEGVEPDRRIVVRPAD
jgi:spoIIIJ-associated protein